MSMKTPLTLAGIEPAAFRFVAQHLNHCATAVPSSSSSSSSSSNYYLTYNIPIIASINGFILMIIYAKYKEAHPSAI